MEKFPSKKPIIIPTIDPADDKYINKIAWINKLIVAQLSKNRMVAASLLSYWMFGLSFCVLSGFLIFNLLNHNLDTLHVIAAAVAVLVQLGYWLMYAHFLKDRWQREIQFEITKREHAEELRRLARRP